MRTLMPMPMPMRFEPTDAERSEPPMLELRILTGLHRGAAFPLDSHPIRLGSAAENDFVLSDPGMPAHEATLAKDEHGAWICRTNANGGSIAVVIGTRIEVGPIHMCVADEAEAWQDDTTQRVSGTAPRMLRTRRAWVIGSCALVVVCALMLLVVQVSTRTPAQAPATEAKPAADTAPIAVPVTAVVHPAPANRMSPPFSLLSVRAGAHGFIVTSDGQVLMQGAQSRSYTLERIEPHRIVFSGPVQAELSW